MLSNSSNYFKKILNHLNLENVVFEATIFTTGTGTCIDLCITNRKKIDSKILRKLEYTSVILSELKTRSFQFVIFISSASPSMSAAL
jgi:hypothetical protein